LLDAIPEQLSETGLFADVVMDTVADGVRSYKPRFELWSDGATKRRWMFVPPGTAIDTSDPDNWNFPAGTKIWKEFTRDGVRVETRLLFKHGEASDAWTPVAYVWRSSDEAWSTPDGEEDALGTSHDVPSASQCVGCHGGARSGVLGVSAIQLPHQGEAGHEGLDSLADAGWLTTPIASSNELPGDPATREALGYLHANCAHCHNQERPERDGPRCFDPESPIDFRLRLDALGATEATAVYRTAVGEVIDAGDPTDSDVIERMRSRSAWSGMPPLGSEVVDEQGVSIVETWIGTL
jgi:hypothetical protein